VAITREEIIEKKKRSRFPRGPEGGFGPAGAQPNPIVMAPAQAGPNQMTPQVGKTAGMRAAMPAPAMTSPRPEVPPAGPSQQDELRNTILQRRQQETLNSRRMGIGMGMSPEALQRADTLRDLRYQKDDLAGSMAPAPKVQSAGEVQAARTNMRGQGLNTVEQTRKQALIAQRSGNEEEAQRLMNEAMRMEIAFRRDFGDHTPEAAQEIVGRQQAGAQRAEAQRGAYGEIAAAQGNDPESIRTRIMEQKKREALGGRMELASGNADIAEQNARGAMAQLATSEAGANADPEVVRANIQARRAMAQSQAMQAQSGVAAANARAAGEGATAFLADPRITSTTDRLKSYVARFGASGFLGSDRGGDVSQFARDVEGLKQLISGLPPEQQFTAKQEILATLTQSGLTDPAYAQGIVGGIGRAFNQGMVGLTGSGTRGDAAEQNTVRYRSAVRGLMSYLSS
jgi:hypothetical protein